jgi:UDP-2,4-diacetamido-2,4,6-trideoxy-beta-L-altropyranose hydrolase
MSERARTDAVTAQAPAEGTPSAPPRVAIRADASVAIGSGHVARCAALAEALRARGAEVVFVCRRQDGDMIAWLRAARFEVRPIAPSGDDWRADADASGAALAGARVDWLIVDHYQLDARWERALRGRAGRVMVIDDLADRDHDADLLLDQNIHPDAARRYDGRLAAHCRRLLGPDYALLRTEFARARGQLRTRDGGVQRILCFFGGADAGNETAKALAALASLARPGLAVDVVLGAANPHRHDLARQYAGADWLRLRVQVDNMAELMRSADLCIGAGGSATWERCCLGLPALLIAVADNQIEIARQCAQLEAAVYLGESAALSVADIAAAVASLLDSPRRLRALGANALRLVDGRGCGRVVDALLGITQGASA